MNVPYKFSENGGAILVPADKVYRTRMQLASQGLPRSGEAGFELLDKTRFGASQFTRSEEHTSELQSLMRISYAVFCLKKKKKTINTNNNHKTPINTV